MIRVNVFVEGQTEETFVRDVLGPYFAHQGIYLTAILASTSKGNKGGIVNYDKVQSQVRRICDRDPTAYTTTLIDYYGLPTNFPSYELRSQAPARERVELLEAAFQQDVQRENFLPNLMLHEFEAYLFCDTSHFDTWFDEGSPSQKLNRIREEFESPEDINNSQQTAPSKRILRCLPYYKKVLHGSNIAREIGIDAIREQCPHFDSWLNLIASLEKRG